MPIADVWIVARWWGTLFLVGAAAFPLTKILFGGRATPKPESFEGGGWWDQGYLFSKAVGMAVVGWIVLVLGMARLASFTETTVMAVIAAVFFFGVFLHRSPREPKTPRSPIWTIMVGEELFFFLALLFWTWVKAHEPSIRGLEKFMDYGFMNSLLQARYFPAMDMWYPPDTINYYYFGHLVVAMLTKLSGLDLASTFNLTLSTIFAFTLTMSFSIGRELLRIGPIRPIRRIGQIFGGLLTAFLVTLAGNMQTMYAFTKGYDGDKVLPFWQLLWSVGEFVQRLPEGLNRYWYANATRFIPYAIHEFPSYSFVVSDVHGHVLSIPFVLLAIGLLIQTNRTYKSYESHKTNLFSLVFYGFLCGVLLMTNALDGPIYFGLFCVIFFVLYTSYKTHKTYWSYLKNVGIVVVAAIAASFPFLSHFSSFVHGVAVNCPLPFLANSKLGILLFEGVEKCQRSPFWMMWILWGFFWFCGGAFILSRIGPIRQIGHIRHIWNTKFTQIEKLLVLFFVFSLGLIIFPEFFYFKDIYPMHFRSNTMFKLGYQAFILFSIVSGYAIINLVTKNQHLVSRSEHRVKLGARFWFVLFLLPQLFFISIYPIFSVRSYFNSLSRYEAISGLNWLALQYPNDYAGIMWLRSAVNSNQRYALVEADGDSYTDYERYSVFTGIPTPIGWAVHEWLWRGSYDVVAPRREDVRLIYESQDLDQTNRLLDTYHVHYIIVGALERQKFINLFEEKFNKLAVPVFTQGDTVIYERAN